MVSELGVVVGALLGIIGLTFLLAIFSPGFAELFGQFINFMASAFRQFIQFLVDNLPKPIRVLLFLLVFASVGGLVYAVTIGSMYVCLDDDVYKTNVITGWSVHAIPMFKEIYEKDPELDFVEVSNISSVSSVAPGWSRNYRAVQIEESGFVRKSEPVTWTSREGNQYSSPIWYFLVSGGDVLTMPSLDEVFLRDEEDLFDTFFTFEDEDYQYALYEICLERAHDTCNIQRKHPIAGISFSTSCGLFETWTEPVGYLYYFYERDRSGSAVVSVGLEDKNKFGASWIPWNVNTLSSCRLAPSSSVILEDFELSASKILMLPPIVVNVGEGDGHSPMSLPLYGAQWAGLFKAETVQQGNQQFYNLSQQPEWDSRDFDSIEAANKDIVRDMLRDSEKVQFDGVGDLVSFTCDEDSDSEYDTNMLVAGIDPFDPLIVGFVFVIGAVFMIFSRVGVFRR